jgi:hypothetical protein
LPDRSSPSAATLVLLLGLSLIADRNERSMQFR